MKPFRAELLGQILLLRVDERGWSAGLDRRLRAVCPGGILLSGSRLRSPAATAELLGRIARALPVAPFLTIEEEGGEVDPLHAFFPSLPSPRAVAQQGVVAVEQLGELVGQACRLLGLNIDLAPVLDLRTPASQPILACRTFGFDPHDVARCGKAYLRALRRKKILACGKHFPGFGSAQVSKAGGLPIVAKPMAALWSEDLLPYRHLLEDLPLVMLSRASYKAYDFDVPRCAMFSASIVEGLLRVKLGYRGVAIAENLEVEAERENLDPGELAVRSLNAGCDLLVLRHEASGEAVLAGMRKAIDAGRLSNRRLRQALRRVQAVNRRLLRPNGKISKDDLDQLTQRFEEFGRRIRPLEKKIA